MNQDSDGSIDEQFLPQKNNLICSSLYKEELGSEFEGLRGRCKARAVIVYYLFHIKSCKKPMNQGEAKWGSSMKNMTANMFGNIFMHNHIIMITEKTYVL